MEIPKEVFAVLKTAAPTLLSAILGPLGGIAATIATAGLEAWLGPSPLPPAEPGAPPPRPPATPDQVVAAIRRNLDDPDIVLALKRVEADLRQYEVNAQIEFARLEQANVDSARRMAADTGLAPTTFRWGMGLVGLAVGLFALQMAALFVLIFVGVDVDPAKTSLLLAAFQFVGTVTGYVAGWASSVVNFYWGSSAGSKEKTDQLAKVAESLGSAVADGAAARKPPVPAPAPPVVVVPAPEPTPVPGPEPAEPPPPPPPQPTPERKASRFNDLVDRLFVHEGGYSDHPSDPGGCTNLGITLGTLRDWRGAEVTCDDVRKLTRDEARQIYHTRYFAPLACDRLPAGLDWQVFDFGVNAGIRRSAKMLQTALRAWEPDLKVDGVVGPLTLAAVAKAPPRDIIEDFHRRRMEFYQGLSTWATFGRGWTKRAESVLADARAACATA